MKRYIYILIIIIFIAGCTVTKESQIKDKVVGTKLSYYGEGGIEEITEVVKEEDIIGIKLVECGWIDHELTEKQCYRAGVGRNEDESSWYIFYDKDSLEQVKVEQLFVT